MKKDTPEQMNMLKISIYAFCKTVLDYLNLEEVVEHCDSPEQYRHLAEQAELYLPADFLTRYSKRELTDIILSHWRIMLKGVCLTFQSKFDITMDMSEE